MTSATARPRRSLRAVLPAVLLTTGCASFVEVPVETPLQSKIDVGSFRRVLVAGFVTDLGDADVDLSPETVRLLQNQLRSNTRMQVLEPDHPPLNDELEKTEKPAGIVNAKDFRHEIVNFVLRARATNAGRNVSWTSYEKLRTVIEKKIFSSTEDLLPVISFNAKASSEERQKHQNFVSRMVEKGYTAKQVRLLVEWYLRVQKSS